MRKLLATVLAGLTLLAAVGLTPTTANAIGFEDSLDDCGYPKLFDAVIMRPIGLAGLAIGATGLTLFTVSVVGPAMVNRDYPQVAKLMVVPAARFTFARRLGECTGF